ncbi:hypothetical protein BaOVIS_022130 [Babesia ovis]|uniref:Rad60/SUMO-like domain-containing protein n=1 Tax=Babesia ovis TaxID=5869 RepID=A0A9W5WVF2_BABOV|nr:hypothetical protein BaOVIS_022130 [Babesia ovis]
MSNYNYPESDGIFSEDVKDPSMFMIHSSDEDDDDGINEFMLTPQKAKGKEQKVNSQHDPLSDKIIRHTRLDDELFDQKLKTDIILTEINKIIEHSVAAPVNEETKGHSSKGLGGYGDDVVVVEEVGPKSGSSSTDGVQIQKHGGFLAEVMALKGKRARKKSVRYGFEEAETYEPLSDGDYVPYDDDLNQRSQTQKKRVSTRIRRSRILEDSHYEESEGPSDLHRGPKTKAKKGSGTTKEKVASKRKDVKRKIVRTPKKYISQSDVSIQSVDRENANQQISPSKAKEQKRKGTVKEQNGIEDDTARNLCLKFAILDENRCLIKDERLDKVFVRHNETIGNLAAKFGKLFNLDENKHKDVKVYIDGDPQPHDITIGNEMLGVEDGMQIDIRFPTKPIENHINVNIKPEPIMGYPMNDEVTTECVTVNTFANLPLVAQPASTYVEVIEID